MPLRQQQPKRRGCEKVCKVLRWPERSRKFRLQRSGSIKADHCFKTAEDPLFQFKSANMSKTHTFQVCSASGRYEFLQIRAAFLKKSCQKVLQCFSSTDQAGDALLQEDFRAAEGAGVVAGHGAAVGAGSVDKQHIARSDRGKEAAAAEVVQAVCAPARQKAAASALEAVRPQKGRMILYPRQGSPGQICHGGIHPHPVSLHPPGLW